MLCPASPPTQCHSLVLSMQLSVRLLAVKGFVLRDVVTTCLSHDILVLDQIGMVKLAHLAEECGSEVISYVEQAEEVRGMLLFF